LAVTAAACDQATEELEPSPPPRDAPIARDGDNDSESESELAADAFPENDAWWLRTLGRTPAFSAPTRDRLIRLSRSDDSAIRLASVRALGRASEWCEPSQDALETLTADPELAVAAAALEETLRRYPISPEADALVSEWLRAEDADKRAAALKLVPYVRAPDRQAWSAVEEIALSDPSNEVRVSALIAFGEHRHRSPTASRAIRQCLDSDDAHTRWSALYTARWCEVVDREIRLCAEAMSTEDQDEAVRDEARAYLLSSAGVTVPPDDE